jgi:hypothetical protein
LQKLNWTQDCCWLAVDELLMGQLQSETPIKRILTHEEDLHFACDNFGNVQNGVDEE